jgi:hypothetical protein
MSGAEGHSAAGKIRLIEKFNGLIANRNLELAACDTVSQPNIPRAFKYSDTYGNTRRWLSGLSGREEKYLLKLVLIFFIFIFAIALVYIVNVLEY